MLGELERAFHQFAGPVVFEDGVLCQFAGRGLTVVFGQRRFGVEQVDLAGSPLHAEMDHGAGARREMSGLGSEIEARRPVCTGGESFTERQQCGAVQAIRHPAEQTAARESGLEQQLREIRHGI